MNFHKEIRKALFRAEDLKKNLRRLKELMDSDPEGTADIMFRLAFKNAVGNCFKGFFFDAGFMAILFTVMRFI